MSQPSGATLANSLESSVKPGIAPAAVVSIGPAETRLTRIPWAPRSRAR